MWRRFLRLVTLRPYGGTLCAPSTTAWMSFAAIGVTLMAGAEAAAWGYVGAFLATQWHRYFAAGAMGLVAFLAVWIVDSTFLTLDLRREEYERRLNRLSGNPPQISSRWQKLKKALSTAGGGVIVRMAMVAGSLFVAAPYVSQLFFYQDVSVVLARQDLINVQAVRNRIASTHDQQIQALETTQETLRTDLILESGRPRTVEAVWPRCYSKDNGRSSFGGSNGNCRAHAKRRTRNSPRMTSYPPMTGQRSTASASVEMVYKRVMKQCQQSQSGRGTPEPSGPFAHFCSDFS